MKTALIIVDVQNDFLPGGALAVPQGDQIIPGINAAMESFDFIVATQDWHPENHGSFAANHPGKNPFEMTELAGLPQCLWPIHCVQNSEGAKLAEALDTARIHHISQKGMDPTIDSYSGFFDNGKKAETDLHAWLQQHKVSRVSICGLATDYCVKATAMDAASLGYETNLLANLCRGVDLTPGDCQKALAAMAANRVKITA